MLNKIKEYELEDKIIIIDFSNKVYKYYSILDSVIFVYFI